MKLLRSLLIIPEALSYLVMGLFAWSLVASLIILAVGGALLMIYLVVQFVVWAAR